MDEESNIDSAWAHAEECEMRRHEEIDREYRKWLIEIEIIPQRKTQDSEREIPSETNSGF